MQHSTLHPLIHKKPFAPFRVTTTDGASYNVHVREGFILTPSYLMIGLLPSADGTDFERVVVLDLFSITTLEHLPVKVPPQGNGQAES